MSAELRAFHESLADWTPSTELKTVLPTSVDNSTRKYFPPVFNQTGNSCAQASGIGYMFTYEMNALLDRDASVKANRFSYLYTWNFLNNGLDEGGFSSQGLLLTMFNGAMTEVDFPAQMSYYQYRWASGYDKYIEAMHYRTKQVLTFPLETAADVENLKRYMYDHGNGSATGGCVIFSTQSSDWKFNNSYSGPSETGYKSLLTQLGTEGAHAMTLVGYDDKVEFTKDGQTHTGAFIAVNSWGDYWNHDNGRYYIPYYFFTSNRNTNILSTDATGVEVEYHTPKMVFKVDMDYTVRNNVSFRMGVADKPYTDYPSDNRPVNIASGQGGQLPMQGSGQSPRIELALNYTDFVKYSESFTEPKYFLTVICGTSGVGHINAFSVADLENKREWVCDIASGTLLKAGENRFSISTTPLKTTSANATKWLASGYAPISSPFVFKNATGGYSKVQFTGYDRTTGRVTLRYLYQPQTANTDLESVQ